MFAVLSPAKRLDFHKTPAWAKSSNPFFSNETNELIKILEKLDEQEMSTLMDLSPSLAKLNTQRYRDFHKTRDCAPAIFAFRGDTYQGLDADSLSREDIKFAQKHLGVLSGLYGLLRPLDAIKPHRLEMGSPLHTPQANNLYEYWGKKITATLVNKKPRAIVILASQEYARVIDRGHIPCLFIDVVFKEQKGASDPKVIGLYAKKARGMMARFIIQNRLTDPEALKEFKTEGYRFQPKESDSKTLVFQRKIKD